MDDSSDRANRWAIGLGVAVLLPATLWTMLSSVMMGFATDSCASGTPCDSGLANAGMAVGFFGALANAVAVIVALLFKVGQRGLDAWIPWTGIGLIILTGMAAQLMNQAAT
ncbi:MULTISPECIES: hypothetical protein [unclassified Rathayibacter]|uniref:hypothetical protein n=1 Tax=unclassified Rathayibacter TaxID=2609250 RepID=UPI0011B05AAE|nr:MULTISPECIES: hypothetical protein [unclassified Rathayibacter]